MTEHPGLRIFAACGSQWHDVTQQAISGAHLVAVCGHDFYPEAWLTATRAPHAGGITACPSCEASTEVALPASALRPLNVDDNPTIRLSQLRKAVRDWFEPQGRGDDPIGWPEVERGELWAA